MNDNIIKFYLEANKLKNVIRTGWLEVGISAKRIESVAEHIYGSIVLAIAIDCEKKLGLNLEKVFKMLVIKELGKIYLEKEGTTNNTNISNQNKELVLGALKNLDNSSSYVEMMDEFIEKKTKEAIFSYNVSKIESDLQAKIYDKNGEFKLENAIDDVKKYQGDLSNEILPNIHNASDGWILFDRKYYDDDLFITLSKDIQEM